MLWNIVSDTGKFWHLSDLHLDYTYHITEDPTKVCFSSKGSPATDPGLFGDFMCDSPYQLILSAFSHMKHVDQQPDFIIWTGYELLISAVHSQASVTGLYFFLLTVKGQRSSTAVKQCFCKSDFLNFFFDSRFYILCHMDSGTSSSSDISP